MALRESSCNTTRGNEDIEERGGGSEKIVGLGGGAPKICIFLLVFATKRSHFVFDGQYYDQVDGVTMGSPLGPVLANILMGHFEEKWIMNSSICPNVWFR